MTRIVEITGKETGIRSVKRASNEGQIKVTHLHTLTTSERYPQRSISFEIATLYYIKQLVFTYVFAIPTQTSLYFVGCLTYSRAEPSTKFCRVPRTEYL